MPQYEIATGIDGFRAAQQDARRNSLTDVQSLHGIMGIQNMMQEQQFMPLKLQQLQLALQNTQLVNDMKQRLLGGVGGPAPAGAPGGQPGGAPPMGAGGTGIPPQLQMALLSGDPGLEKWAAAHLKQIEPVNVRPGGTVYIPGQGPQYTAPQNGVTTNYGPGGPAQALMPGAPEASAAMAGAHAGGEAAGRAPFQIGTVNTPGAPTLMTNQQQIEAATGRPMPTPGMPNLPPPTALPQRQSGVPQDISGPLAQLSQNFPAQAAQGADIQRRETMPNGGGMIPTPSVIPPRVPGLQLQDQQETAREHKFGAELAQLQREAPQARATVADANSNLLRLETVATDLMNSPELGRVTGFTGAFPSFPGGKAADLTAKFGTLKSQVGFGALQAMREASKTGGALGNVSDAEGKRLEANLAALDKAQSEPAMKEALKTIIDYTVGARERINRAYADNYERVIGNQGVTPTPQGAVPAGSTPAAKPSGRVIKWSEL